MKTLIQTAPRQETALLVAVATPQQPLEKTQEYLAELSLLCDTLQIKPVKTCIQHLKVPHPKTLIGQGKLEEIKTFIQTTTVDKVIFDDELTAAQTRNIEKILECTVLDRNAIILDIFAMRAQTKEAKIQVEIAQYQYLLPRLKKMWSHLSRQQGGVSGMRGPGEKELETDRRIVQHKISLLRKKLDTIDKQRLTQCKQREKLVQIALVGYTNVGKSTLMQVLSKSETYVADKLFATITSTTRRTLIGDIPCLLTDTVGFIRKLPHSLIVSFKSTLDEIREADVLLHVVDASHPACQEYIQIVQQTLQEIGAENIPTFLVFNKTDQILTQHETTEPGEGLSPIEALRQQYGQREGYPVVFISAKENDNTAHFKELLYQYVRPKHLLIYPNYLKSESL